MPGGRTLEHLGRQVLARAIGGRSSPNILPLNLFTRLPRRRILGSSYPRACIKRCTQNVYGRFAPVRHLWASRLSFAHHDHHIISPKTSSYGGGATCL
jgi:hypothetical protein